jgi:hypothetical protein
MRPPVRIGFLEPFSFCDGLLVKVCTYGAIVSASILAGAIVFHLAAWNNQILLGRQSTTVLFFAAAIAALPVLRRRVGAPRCNHSLFDLAADALTPACYRLTMNVVSGLVMLPGFIAGIGGRVDVDLPSSEGVRLMSGLAIVTGLFGIENWRTLAIMLRDIRRGPF